MNKLQESWTSFQRLLAQLKGKQSSYLAQCIRIEEQQLMFYLNEPMLQAIQGARSSRERLEIPWKLLAQMRKLVVFDGQLLNRLQSGLTFCTYYVGSANSQKTGRSQRGGQGEIVLRTILSPDGDIIHQVCRNYIQHPRCLDVVVAHHWLINQLLGNLGGKTGQVIQIVSWTASFVSVWVPSILSIISDLENTVRVVVSALVGVVLVWPVQIGMKRLLRALSPWLLRTTVSQMLSPNPFFRNVGTFVWQRFVG